MQSPKGLAQNDFHYMHHLHDDNSAVVKPDDTTKGESLGLCAESVIALVYTDRQMTRPRNLC